MKFILLCILLFACSFSGNAIHFFNGTYEEALQLAKKEKKNLFISFTASWCGPCRMMKKVVFEDPQVVRYADQHYICLNADIEYPEFRLLQCKVNPNRAGIIPHICIPPTYSSTGPLTVRFWPRQSAKIKICSFVFLPISVVPAGKWKKLFFRIPESYKRSENGVSPVISKSGIRRIGPYVTVTTIPKPQFLIWY